MMLARTIQSVRSPWIRWPTTSKGEKLWPPSFCEVQKSGRSRNSALRATGVRASNAIVFDRVDSMPLSDATNDGWMRNFMRCSARSLHELNLGLAAPDCPALAGENLEPPSLLFNDTETTE